MSHKCGSVAVLLGLILTAALYGQNEAYFSKFVVAGDSLSAGYQNSQLIESGQVHGYANVIAIQAGVDLKLPIIPLKVFPSPLQGGYPQITIVPNSYAVVTGLTPVDRLNTDQTLDVAVPGFTVAMLVGYPACAPVPDIPIVIQVLAAEILNPNCTTIPFPTELEEARSLKPTTAILWIGSNDALFSLLFGGDPTDVATFSGLHGFATTTMALASKHLVVANIPDVTLTAYLTSVTKLAAILNLPVNNVEKKLGLQPDDMVTPYAFAAIQAMRSSLKVLPDSGPQGPIVIRAATLSTIRATVIAYNAAIAQEATDNHATLVDIFSLINDLAKNGKDVGGRHLTTDFMGGLFSLDGVHPTNTGYAIIANEFIKTMNASLGTNIPLANVVAVSQHDPLIFPDSDHRKHTGHVDVGMADGLRHLRRR